ncbi:unnamed protein product, partial [Mesorhabditis belari]|uniref:Uncharacterized protein n=1 Tax=Mesorhabditis belari TaxID=2138241 RepID=A0AAF3ECE7_9BILA
MGSLRSHYHPYHLSFPTQFTSAYLVVARVLYFPLDFPLPDIPRSSLAGSKHMSNWCQNTQWLIDIRLNKVRHQKENYCWFERYYKFIGYHLNCDCLS